MEGIVNTVKENIGLGAQNIGQSQFSLEEVPDLSGKVAFVTGGSEGVGYGLTHTLLSKGISKLFVTSLRQETGDEALKAIEEELGADVSKRVVYIQNDQSDWVAAAKMASSIADQTDRLDILINNAARGIMTRQLEPKSQSDLHLAINHVGHVVITSHLLPLLKKTADAGHTVRIVNLASNLHESAPKDVSFSAADWNDDLGGNGQYARSKLANLLHARYLNKHLHSSHPKILINATHPGIVDTAQTSVHIHEAYPLMGYGMSKVMKPFQKTQFEGAVSSMYAATVIDQSGLYVAPPCIIEKGSDKSNDMELAEQLMKYTRELTEKTTRPDSSEKGCPFKDA